MGFLLLVGLVACSNDADNPHGASVLEQSDGSLQGLQLAVPEGAYTGSEPLTMTAGADIATEGLMDPSMTTESVGQAVAFGPSGTQFVQPVTIALPFSKAAYNGANLTGKMIDVLHQTADGAVAGFDVGPIGLSTIGFDVGPIGFDVGPIGLQANEGNEENDLLIIFQTTHFSTFQVVVVGQPVDFGCTPNCQPGPMACGDDGCGGSCGECGPQMNCAEGTCVDLTTGLEAVCTSDNDRTLLGQKDVNVVLDQCMATTCEVTDSAVDQECITGCIEVATTLSGLCSSCFAALAQCAVTACEANGTCGASQPSWTCRQQCVGSEACWEELATCTGLCGDDVCQDTVEDSNNCAADCPGCTPQCDDQSCGDDGCGGTCGDCGPGQQCKDGQCTIVCAVDCAEKDCGDDGCGGTCGDCASDEQCSEVGVCECKPQCDGKNCGDDGCDGSCGDCGTGQQCEDGQCTALCVQDCAGKECGDDGCGGTCGDCQTGFECSQFEPVCLPITCDAAEIVFVDQQVCVGQTLIACTTDDFGNWTLAATYCPSLGQECNTIEAVPPKEAECKSVCVADCTGKVCGLDGCGGSCGTCSSKEYCSDGQCYLTCTPDCAGKSCGSDGCGGQCGSCTAGGVCATDGVCVPQDCMSANLAASETQQTCFGNTLAECNVDTFGNGAVSYSTTYCPNTAMTCQVTEPSTPSKAECQCDDALCQALMGDPCIFAASCVGTGPDSFCEMESYEGCIGVGNGGFVVQDPTPGGSTKDMATTPDASMNFEAISVVVDSSIPAHIITLHLLAPWDSNPNATGLRVYEVLLQKLTQLAGTGASNEEAPLAGATNRTQWSNLAADQSWASYAMAWNGSGWDDEITPKIASCVPGKNDNTTIVCTVPHNTVACQDLFDPDETSYKVYTRYTTATGEVATKAWTSYGPAVSGGFISL